MHGFELIKKKYIKDINAEVYLYEHKTGARLLFAINGDKNRVFMPVFGTLSEDNMGAAHIVEHCTLLGSEKYPFKDPFARLAKRSIYTYLNAITYPDKTVYPIASTDENELYKMAEVYIDGIFKPLMMKNEGIFQQEGVRFEKEGANGIVLNEMKGYFDNSRNLLYNSLKAELYKGCNYENCSAGLPCDIEELTYNDFKKFYNERYTADNCIIYIYGDIDISRYMKLIEPYLKEEEGRKADDSIIQNNLQKGIKVKTGKNEKISGAVFGGCGSVSFKESVYLRVLREALECEYKNTLPLDFVYNCDEHSDNFFICSNTDYKTFCDTLEAFFEHIAEKGFSEGTIENAVNKIKFYYKEKDFGYKPTGLFYGLELVKGLLYHNNSLDFGDFETVLEDMTKTNFRALINKYFINKGVWGYTTEGKSEKEPQKRPVNDEPFLKFANLPEKADISTMIPGKTPDGFKGEIFCPATRVEKGFVFTEGKGDIVYLDFLYPIQGADVSAAALYAHTLETLNTNAHFGRLRASVEVIDGNDGVAVFFKISTAFIRENTEKCIDELKNIFNKYQYKSDRGLKEKIKQGFSTKGEYFAILQSLSCINNSSALKNHAEGAELYLWLNRANTEKETEAFYSSIKVKKPVIVLRGNEKERRYILDNVDFAENLPSLRHMDCKFNDTKGLVINSRTNCNSLSLKLPCCDVSFDVAAAIAEQYYFWEKIRSGGGAYGAGCKVTETGFMYMYSLKDPCVMETFKIFKRTGEYLSDLKITDEEFNSVLVSCAWKMTKPLKKKEINAMVLSELLRGDTLEKKNEELEKILSLSPADIKRAGYVIGENMNEASYSAVGGKRVQEIFERYICLD